MAALNTRKSMKATFQSAIVALALIGLPVQAQSMDGSIDEALEEVAAEIAVEMKMAMSENMVQLREAMIRSLQESQSELDVDIIESFTNTESNQKEEK